MMRFWVVASIATLSGCGTTSGIHNAGFGSFTRSLSNTTYGYQVVDDHTGTAPSKKIDKFELRAGDCSFDAIHNDCKNSSERTELAGPKNIQIGSEEWYGWYIYVPADFKDVYPAHCMVGQFYHSDVMVVLGIKISNAGMQVDHFLKNKNSAIYDIDNMRGKWTKVEVHARWERELSDKNGFVDVYFNDKIYYSFKGNTTYDKPMPLYFKYGIYRNRLFQLKGTVPTQVLYYSNVSKATSRESLFK